MALSLELFQHPPGVTAVAQGGVQTGLPRLDIQKFQNFIHHDGEVHPGGSFAAFDDLFHVVPVLFGVQLFIFLPVVPGVRTFVAHTALVLLFHGDQLLYPIS